MSPASVVLALESSDRNGYRRLVRDGEWIRFVIKFEVRDLDRFREMATAMVAVARDEPGTVVYDWYLDEASVTGTLYEAYASNDALQAHGRGTVFTELRAEVRRRGARHLRRRVRW